MTDKKRLVIVDVSNFIFRAFFAIRPMHSPQGVPTNAVYGIVTMLLKLLSDYRPTHLFLARDTKGGSFRNEIYKDYKANRLAPPEELIPQFSLIDELISKMNLPTFSHEHYEADDIIGSACTQWKDQFDEILIASSDKDLMQFVGGNVKIIDTMKEKIYTEKEVEEKMGVRPDQVIDYLAMVGDTSDNIPGMKGIGAVGAQKLLKEYGTFENIVKHREELKGKKILEAFNNDLENGELSRKLVTIPTDVDLCHRPEETAVKFYPTMELSEYLKSLGFTTILNRLQDMRFQYHLAQESDKNVISKSIDETQNAEDQLSELPLLKKAQGKTQGIVDRELEFKLIEMTPQNYDEVMLQILNLNPCQLAVLPVFDREDIYLRKMSRMIFYHGGEVVYVASEDLVGQILSKILTDNRVQLLGHDLKDLWVYALVNNISITAQVFDIGLAHFNLNSAGRHELDVIIQEYFQVEISSDEKRAEGERTFYLFKLAKIFKEKMQEMKVFDLYQNIDLKIISVLAKMEKEGIALNVNYLKELESELLVEIKKVEDEIFKLADAPINLNSPKQVGFLLFEKLNLPVIKKTKTGYSTDAEVLEELEGMNISEIPGLLLTYREYGKILSTYVKALPELVNSKSRRIHTHFNLTVAQTGRLSSTNPNLQNIPIRSPMGEKVRKAFIARPGRLLLSADYSQVELRLLAHFSSDEMMCKAFRDGIDIHAQTASEVLNIPLSAVTSNDRSRAKAVNFGLMYGQSSFGLASTLKISRQQAKDYIDKYFARFSSIKTFLDTLKDKAEATGVAETFHGRKRLIPEIHSANRTIKAQGERIAINSPIQGTAADIIKMAMIQIDREMGERGFKSKMILQVHDELIFEVEEDELSVMTELVRRGMESVVELKVPLKVDMGVGVNWYDMKDHN